MISYAHFLSTALNGGFCFNNTAGCISGHTGKTPYELLHSCEGQLEFVIIHASYLFNKSQPRSNYGMVRTLFSGKNSFNFCMASGLVSGAPNIIAKYDMNAGISLTALSSSKIL